MQKQQLQIDKDEVLCSDAPARCSYDLTLSMGGASSVDDFTSSADVACEEIVELIVTGEFKPGDVLVCSKLATLLDISRTPVAIALDRLVNDGLLEKEKYQRARVREGAENWLLQIHCLRELVEPTAAVLAAKYITDECLAALQELAEASTPGSDNNWLHTARAFDFALHLSIADHSQNLPLRELIRKCWRFKALSYKLHGVVLGREAIGHREHLAILEALSRHDSETASAAMLYHLKSSLSLSRVRKFI